ncbi:hypothetical protein KKB07_04230 [bacterium]|nr:hypothetical protein [bacterium]
MGKKRGQATSLSIFSHYLKEVACPLFCQKLQRNTDLLYYDYNPRSKNSNQQIQKYYQITYDTLCLYYAFKYFLAFWGITILWYKPGYKIFFKEVKNGQ